MFTDHIKSIWMEWQGKLYRLLSQSHYFPLLESWSASSGRILHNTVNCALPACGFGSQCGLSVK